MTTEEWIRLYEPGLLMFARLQVGYHQAEDVRQEVLIRAVPRIRSITDPPSWLRATAMNVINDELRKKFALKRGGRQTHTDLAGDTIAELADDMAWCAEAGLSLEQTAEYLDVIALLRTLPPQLRHVGYLLVFEQATQAEVARELGCSQTNVAKLIKKANVALTAARPEARTETAKRPQQGATEGRTA
ncbi:sigma-70 family RNA polymerase sigma factor [Catenulispora subtropica]|uniref:sigma-70 family RNA polymerase sigma factor n=1 Tax=Catenulispora subtropica TaxID=450798 RepID=UPI0031E189E9